MTKAISVAMILVLVIWVGVGAWGVFSIQKTVDDLEGANQRLGARSEGAEEKLSEAERRLTEIERRQDLTHGVRLAALEESIVPVGSIVAWDASIPLPDPSRWVECTKSGQERLARMEWKREWGRRPEVPDLEGRFVCGAGAADDVGSIGGCAQHIHDMDHVHSGSTEGTRGSQHEGSGGDPKIPDSSHTHSLLTKGPIVPREGTPPEAWGPRQATGRPMCPGHGDGMHEYQDDDPGLPPYAKYIWLMRVR